MPYRALLLIGIIASLSGSAMAGVDAPPADRLRIVTLGDSITDGHTYALLVQQALSEARKPVPFMIGAGVGGDTAAQILTRLDRDVFPNNPQIVLLDDGINDLNSVSAADYESRMTEIVDRLQSKKIEVILLTTTTMDGAHAPIRPKQEVFNQIVRKIAASHHLKVGEVNAVMTAAGPDSGQNEADGCHLNLAGYLHMTRAILDVLGYTDVPVPQTPKFTPLVGILPTWHVRPMTENKPLTAEQVAALQPADASFKILTLPESEPIGHWWKDQERQRGVAVALDRVAGDAGRYVSVAAWHSEKDRDACLNTGADLRAAWVNGKKVYDGTGCGAWHPGANRIPIHLNAGDNTVVVESGANFFLSITDSRWW